MHRGTITHYEVLEKLGHGGMGTVYKARDLRLQRLVALKFLSQNLLDSPEARARFLREGQALSSLNHAHIATIYEVDEVDGEPFLAIEYLPGGTLRSRIEAAGGGGIDLAEVKETGAAIAEALDHAHLRGVIHRDVKSANVMFDAEGRAKLTDFGLAKMAHGPDLTGLGMVAGTVAYMSPEQVSGEPVDHRSDLFSLGVVLYEAVTGRLPFEVESAAAVMERILHASPVPVARVRPETPKELDSIIARLLEKSPTNRYRRAEDVARALRGVSDRRRDSWLDETVPMWLLRLASFSRRRWLKTAAVAGAAAVVVAVLASVDGLRRWLSGLSPPEQKHVAVLPVRCIGGQEDQQPFCDGLTDTLTTALTQLGTFSVLSPTEARRVTSAEQARREFGVNVVVYSSLQVQGGRARLIVSLIDAERNRQLGAATIDGSADRLHLLEDGMLTQAARLMDVALARPPASLMAAGGQVAQGAYDAYLRGRGFLYRFDKAGNLDRALEQFEAAALSDPKFPPAYVGIAETHLRIFRARREPQSLDAGRVAVQRALDLNPLLASAHVVKGAILAESGQPADAVGELQEALRLDVRDPAVYRELAAAYRAQRRFAEAEQVYQRAIAARPGDWLSYSNLAVFHYSRQRYADAERLFREATVITPDNHIAWRNLGTVLVSLGRHREAEEALRRAVSLRPSARTYSNLGSLYLLQRKYAASVPPLEKAAELALQESPADHAIWGNLGDAYLFAGTPGDKPSAAYRRALETGEKLLAGGHADAGLLVQLAKYHARLGERTRALERAEAAVKADPADGFVRYMSSIVYALLGETDRSLAELAAAIERSYSLEEIQRAPELAAVRAHPAYKDLTTRAGRR